MANNIYIVRFVYQDFTDEEEPYMDECEIEASSEDEAIEIAYEKFTPIEVFDVELIKED